MPAQSNLAPVTAPKLGTPIPIIDSSQPKLAVVPTSQPIGNANAYRHTIESGESLYTIARRYDVTAQSIVEANGFTSPDKIYRRPEDRHPRPPRSPRRQGSASTQVAMVGDEPTAAPVATPVAPAATTAAIANPNLLNGTAPVVDAAPAQPTAAQVADHPAAPALRHKVPLAGERQGHRRLCEQQGHRHQHRGA